MKKIMSLLLTFALLLGVFSACGNGGYGDDDRDEGGKQHGSSVNKNDGDDGSDGDDIQNPKFSGKIGAKTIVSEGKMMVRATSDDGTFNAPGKVWYCINTSGEILFEVTARNNGYMSESRFVNGFISFDEGLCDIKGKLVYPEDVGATKFYWHAFDAGYIIVERITADYAGTKKELGIMNTKREWVVPISEAFYAEMMYEDKLVFEAFSSNRYPGSGDYLGSGCHFYCQDDYLYIKPFEKFLDLKTGKTVADSDGPQIQQPETWDLFDRCYFDRKRDVVLNLRHLSNLERMGYFVNGIAPIMFHNEDVNGYYLSAANESGELVFEPQKVAINNYYEIATDGETILVYCHFGSDVTTVWTFDIEGNLIGELDVSEIDYSSSSVQIEDGVVSLEVIGKDGYVDLYTKELKPLF